MKKHLCLFCIGSNTDFNKHVPFVREELTKMFPSVLFGKAMITEPLNIQSSSCFLNQLGYFYTDLMAEEIISFFKSLELKCGRNTDDKQKSIIKMDLDLLIYDKHILKPKDFSCGYIKEGLKSLSLKELC